ncbi:cell division protein FtsN [Conservatibacter flavescens]|uniref:Cell division protein FtsN n=1 Tax=Conservatibacter flavescens TaxID=28161 RepID=A0A2M8S3I4_9PAST|nr:cell division protein FtsN [Conservatibacter flavescens]PJG85700.1 cell division protein FtsN [Conservatibacter flavescens]
MAQRDYAARSSASRKKKKSNGISKTTVLFIVGIVLVMFAGGLYFLKKNAPEVEKRVDTQPVEPTTPKSVLPSRPEEVWSYIQDLETREIPVDNSPGAIDKNAQLTAEQKRILAMLEQDKLAQQKKAEEAKKAALARAEQQAQEAKTTESKTPPPVSKVEKPQVVEAKPEVKKAEPVKVVAKPATEQQKQEVVKEAAKKEPAKPTSSQSTAGGKFGLQCGAFKNKGQAENLQARLAMAGFNSRVTSSADWNRVFVGPVGDRAAAAKAQADAKSITNCVIIGM